MGNKEDKEDAYKRGLRAAKVFKSDECMNAIFAALAKEELHVTSSPTDPKPSGKPDFIAALKMEIGKEKDKHGNLESDPVYDAFLEDMWKATWGARWGQQPRACW